MTLYGREYLCSQCGQMHDLSQSHAQAIQPPAPSGASPTPFGPHCAQCGYTADNHCDLDEPGLDHAVGCDMMHHEFKPKARPAERREEQHVCGLSGYNPMIDPMCPACEKAFAERDAVCDLCRSKGHTAADCPYDAERKRKVADRAAQDRAAVRAFLDQRIAQLDAKIAAEKAQGEFSAFDVGTRGVLKAELAALSRGREEEQA